LDIGQIQGGSEQLIDTTEDDLMENLLALKQYKHHRHLRYLSQKHERSILKLRFVLEPFSFVFLLSGNDQYHLVWETLDTEETTYIWHINKSVYELERSIKRIDVLGQIRTKGRQECLETNPEHFSRIVHDYSDEQKGLIIWKDQWKKNCSKSQALLATCQLPLHCPYTTCCMYSFQLFPSLIINSF
jgi:hypothetical protein